MSKLYPTKKPRKCKEIIENRKRNAHLKAVYGQIEMPAHDRRSMAWESTRPCNRDSYETTVPQLARRKEVSCDSFNVYAVASRRRQDSFSENWFVLFCFSNLSLRAS